MMKNSKSISFNFVNQYQRKQSFQQINAEAIQAKPFDSLALMPNQFAYLVECENNRLIDYKGSLSNLLGLKTLNSIEDIQDRIKETYIDKYIKETVKNFEFMFGDFEKSLPMRNIFSSTFMIQVGLFRYQPFMRQTFSMRSDNQGIITHTGGIYTLIEGVKINTQPFINHKVYGPDAPFFIHKETEKFKNIFSNRELQVLNLLADGYRNRAISEKLFISVNTVETHRKNMLTKLEAKSSANLIAIAKDMGLI
ncbi:response regulator transcription factor [Marivirga sp.]|uniref:response regulator transcription factor n=1 Tax=Marivirga sp. TaxID=2018662 RepID=UPI003DA705D2